MVDTVSTTKSSNGFHPESVHKTANGSTHQDFNPASSASETTQAPVVRNIPRKYKHVIAIHSRPRASCLSHDREVAPSFLGFRNLMVLVLIFSNLRLMIENYQRYGVLICLRCHDYRRQDVILGAALYLLVPCHLFVAYCIELVAGQQAKMEIGRRKKLDISDASTRDEAQEQRDFQSRWKLIVLAHTINASLCLSITTVVVYCFIHHPLIGTLSELHAIIVWLKNCSYAFTNRDLRHAFLSSDGVATLPPLYASLPYPQNITFRNISYFWWAPTLVYQPVYPRSSHIRWEFVAKRVGEFAALSMFIWIASAQYAAPVLQNSLDKIQTLNFPLILERLMKLSTISLVIWLAGFFALFQSALNALAEVMTFGDREFYTDWWNSPSVASYWRMWNRPVYQFMKRHIHMPLVGRGWSPYASSVIVFLFSAVLHELLVGVPTHNIIGVAFFGMMFQLPLMAITQPLERMHGMNGKIIGNAIFWVSFVLVGQPLAALLYFFAWQAKYGSIRQR
ncbi:MAG: hypothetical protein M1825_005096 [Sarcosagium campestre]|nr:MAG: hypothetical protein M1825_005096 [Sarcosagium campestre]